MATWRYEAKNSAGTAMTGTLVASDRRAALEILRSQGLFLTLLEAAPTRKEQKAVPPVSPKGANIPSAGNNSFVDGNTAPRPAPRPRTGPVAPLPNVPSRGVEGHTGAETSKEPPPIAPPPPASAYGAAPRNQSGLPPLERQPFLNASKRDLSAFFGQMASAANAGVSTGKALSTLENHATNKTLRTVAGQLSKRTMSGESLSEGMRAFPGLFTPLMVGIVSAGERGGFLDRSFSRLSEYAERDYQLETSIKKETWYPKLIVFASILIPGVVPLVLQGFGPFLRQVVPPLFILGLLWAIWKAIKIVRPSLTMLDPFFHFIDGVKLVLPIIGKVSRGLATAKFCRALGALYAAGVSPSQSIRFGAEACGNQVMHDRCMTVIPRLEQGETLTQALGSLRVFHPMALQMMQVGEESGDLDSQLEKAADFLESDAETAIRQAIPVLGILAFLAVAAYVASTVISAYSGYGAQINDLIDNP